MQVKVMLIALLFSAVSFAAEVPSISADMGPCSAQFTVTNGTKPIYDAKVRTRIKYGSFGLRKLDLEVGTNSDGRAAVIKLPDVVRQPIAFEVIKDDVSRTVLFDPAQKCDATYKVELRKPQSMPSAQPPENPQP